MSDNRQHFTRGAPFVAVHGRLDEHTSRLIHELRDQLPRNTRPIDLDERAHVTFAICPRGIVTTICRAMSSMTLDRPIPVEFSHVGIFASPIGVVFLGTNLSAHLSECHGEIHRRLAQSPTVHSKWYVPGRWTPHATLAMPVELDMVGDVAGIAATKSLPTDSAIDAIRITQVDDRGRSRLAHSIEPASSVRSPPIPHNGVATQTFAYR